jgi:N-ethylmaleimide reductase
MQPEGRLPLAPSAIAPRGQLFTHHGRQPFVTPRALELGEIPVLVEQFARAARLAKAAGFGGVDIHAANGYLIDQFLRDGSNQRSDGYGGTIAKRARFLLEVVEAVAAVWGVESVGVRVSPLGSYNCMHDSDPAATFGYVAKALRCLGVGYLHVAEPGLGHPLARAEGRELVCALRRAFAGRFIVDGGRDRYTAESYMKEVGADLVALATPFIANPDLVERLARGLPLCSADPDTFYSGGPRGYIDYPVYDASAYSPSALNGSSA